jgi:hypothetical protein
VSYTKPSWRREMDEPSGRGFPPEFEAAYEMLRQGPREQLPAFAVMLAHFLSDWELAWVLKEMSEELVKRLWLEESNG